MVSAAAASVAESRMGDDLPPSQLLPLGEAPGLQSGKPFAGDPREEESELDVSPHQRVCQYVYSAVFPQRSRSRSKQRRERRAMAGEDHR